MFTSGVIGVRYFQFQVYLKWNVWVAIEVISRRENCQHTSGVLKRSATFFNDLFPNSSGILLVFATSSALSVNNRQMTGNEGSSSQKDIVFLIYVLTPTTEFLSNTWTNHLGEVLTLHVLFKTGLSIFTVLKDSNGQKNLHSTFIAILHCTMASLISCLLTQLPRKTNFFSLTLKNAEIHLID